MRDGIICLLNFLTRLVPGYLLLFIGPFHLLLRIAYC